MLTLQSARMRATGPIVPTVEVPGPLVAGADNPATRAGQSQVYASEDAFDMPQLIGALAATLAAAGGEVN